MNLRQFAVGLCFLASAGNGFASDEEPIERAPSLFDSYASTTQELVLRSLSFIGVNYRRGGESPEVGFDCSGFVRHVFRETLGLALPRTAREISRVGESVSTDNLEPGDLVFYNTRRKGFSHVGIYLGEHRFVHAPASGGEVRLEDMRTGYWMKRFNGARRIATTEATPVN
jgi:cell wall-associated NlpC family hydrolase